MDTRPSRLPRLLRLLQDHPPLRSFQHLRHLLCLQEGGELTVDRGTGGS
jgi:hypothetical protein